MKRRSAGHEKGATRARGGYTLVELVVSSAIASILLLAVSSAILLASRAVPDSQSPALAAIEATRIVDQMATELESALYISERSPSTLGFTVADRNGDGIPERIRYAWPGTPGTPLTRSYNGAPPIALADKVDLFTLTPSFQSVTETYPGTGADDATESVLIDAASGDNPGSYDIDSTDWTGQYLAPVAPTGAVAWRPTRVELEAANWLLAFGSTAVQMRIANASMKPSDVILEQRVLDNFLLGTGYATRSITFNQISRLAPTAPLCLVLQPYSGNGCRIRTYAGQGQLTTGHAGSFWAYSNTRALSYRLYGKLTMAGPPQYATTRYLTTMAIQLRVGSANAPLVRTTAQTLNHPELLAGFWELAADKDPTRADLNGDGAGDWVVRAGSGFSPASVVNGVWQTANASLATSTGSNFASLTVIDMRFRVSGAGGSGTACMLNAARSGTLCAPLGAYLQPQADGTQMLTIYNQTGESSIDALFTIPGLPGQLIDLHLIIDPATSSIGVTVNNVQMGTFPFTRFNSSSSDRTFSILSGSAGAEFQYVRVRVMDPTP